jgi:hypothetical protein
MGILRLARIARRDRLARSLAVAIAGLGALAASTGCYAPSLRDCTVSCESAGDCASGQVCGSDGLCAAPEAAGHCATAEVDAGDADASPPGDAAVPDAPKLVALHVQVDGKVSIEVAGLGVCSSKDPSHGRCMYDIALGIAQRVDAIAVEPDQQFAGWTSPTCAGQGAVCTFVPLTMLTSVVAKFR